MPLQGDFNGLLCSIFVSIGRCPMLLPMPLRGGLVSVDSSLQEGWCEIDFPRVCIHDYLCRCPFGAILMGYCSIFVFIGSCPMLMPVPLRGVLVSVHFL